MCTTSMMPAKASPVPMGMVTAPTRLPKRSLQASMALSKSDSGRSRRLMTTARAMDRSSAANHKRVVVVCGPSLASTTNRAVSAALMAVYASPTKSG